MGERIKITCSVEQVRYYKEEFGIIIASIDKIKEGTPKVSKTNEIVLRGAMPQPFIGNMYNVVAEHYPDPKWGDQYNIISIYSALVFEKGDSVSRKKFLSSIFTPLQVSAMYEALDDPFTALDTGNIEELITIKGCGLHNATRWIDKFKENYYLGKIFTELEDYNLTNNMIKRLVERYGSPEIVIEKVKNNPYVLCNEVQGIGWKTADKIALDGGMELFCTKRIGAYILYYLNQVGENGCSWIIPDELMGALLEEFGEEIPDENISQAIHELEDKLWWNEEKTKIGLKRYYEIEYKIAQELIRIRDAETKIVHEGIEQAVSKLERQQGWEFTDEQVDGAKKGLRNNIIVVEGLAGTGKTSVVSLILEVLKNYSFVQTALSGRASARMAEVTGEEGFTIHRLLGYPQGDKQGFIYHDEHPLPYDVYILDEMSMVDAYLFYYLLRAIPNGAKLFLLGDIGQLESIGSGNIAYDMIKSPEIATATLTKIHRQAAASAIITESIKVRHGEQIVPKDWSGTEIRGELNDLKIIGYSDASNTFYKVMQEFSQLMSDPDFNIMETQVVVPIKNRGAACTYELNNAIQELYNPHSKKKKEITLYTKEKKPYILREGDKVINVANNYKLEKPIYNGNIGVIKAFDVNDEFEDVMIIEFPTIGVIALEKKYWNSIELSYAITVHKVQGSQFNNVIVGIDFSSYALLTRELLYTAITRAKKMCILAAQISALRMATSKEGVVRKQTHLQECLHDVAHPKLIF